ncbi:MAG: hypothetical protein HYY46_08440 [Deltaproteobacteria bacterium]|nr:hypothetical protein [Deltaproteobacteria bacterium]
MSCFDKPVLNPPFSFDTLRMNGGVDQLSTNGRRSVVPVFEAGRYLVAFDGAALLLLDFGRRRG